MEKIANKLHRGYMAKIFIDSLKPFLVEKREVRHQPSLQRFHNGYIWR